MGEEAMSIKNNQDLILRFNRFFVHNFCEDLSFANLILSLIFVNYFYLFFQKGKYKVEKVPVKDLTLEDIRKKNVDFARTDIGMFLKFHLFSY